MDSDGSCKRRLALSLNGDVADDLQLVSRHGRGNDNSNSNGLFLMGESFDLFFGLGGGEVGARRLLLVEGAGVMKDRVGNASNEVVDMLGISLSLVVRVPVNIFFFQRLWLKSYLFLRSMIKTGGVRLRALCY